MFLDQISVRVVAGKGGDGASSFRREKFVPRGGPDGGDGGRGGHVIFRAEEGISTLYHLRYKRIIRAENGANGEAANRTGRSGRDVVVGVPVGTLIRRHDDGSVIADLYAAGQEAVVAHGGRGGRGNSHFATPTRQTPRYSEKGEPGEDLQIDLELKLLADVGLVGLPNAGKSTLLSRISAAKPKIADYPFTTIVPNLGVASIDGESFVVADIPGLVEGAHRGAGLGHKFLRHIERTRLLLHLVDLGGWEERDPLAAYEQINRELGSYQVDLSQRPQIVVANKMDLPEAQERWPAFAAALEESGAEVYPVSAATGSGIPELLRRVAKRLKEIPLPEPVEVEIREAPRGVDFSVEKVGPGVYRIEGDWIWRRVSRFNLEQDESLFRLTRLLQKWGVEDALIDAGAKEGDTVLIRDLEFIYSPDKDSVE